MPSQTRGLIEGQIQSGNTLISLAKKDRSPATWPHFSHPNHSAVVASGLRSLYQLRKILIAHKPDIVHITGIWIPIHQLWALEVSRAKIPYVVSIHGNLSPLGTIVRFGGKKQYPFHAWRKKIWHQVADRYLLKYAAGAFVHSRYEAEILKGFGVKNISVVPAGIEPKSVESKNFGTRELHRPITFLHLGRLDIYHKGLDLICDALKKLSVLGQKKSFKVIFVGPTVGDSQKKLEEASASLGKGILEIRNAIWGNAKEDLWNEVDYFFNVYRFAGMALAPAEALARGIPLIASREGNFGDWLHDRKMGFTVPLDSHAICNQIMSILDISNREYQLISRNALSFSKLYTWERIAQETVSNYRKHLLAAQSTLT